jgi:hypothetical protein
MFAEFGGRTGTPTSSPRSVSAVAANINARNRNGLFSNHRTNPHCFFYIDVKNGESGKVENWALELGNPNALLRAGWTPNSVKIGEEVTVEGTRAKDGTFLGNARSMVLMRTGQRLFAGSSQTTNP